MAGPWENDPIIEPPQGRSVPWENDPIVQGSGDAPVLVRDPNGQPVVMRPPRADAPQITTPEAPPSRGERLASEVGRVGGDMARSAASGLVRGTTALADTPGMLWRGGHNAVEGIFRMVFDDPPEWTQQITEAGAIGPFSGTAGRDAVAALPGGGDALNYSPQTTAGEFTQTAAEFAPGAALLGGPRAVVPYGVVPGIASEAAGQATEGVTVPEGVPVVGGMDVEPAARFAGAVLGPAAGGAAHGQSGCPYSRDGGGPNRRHS